MLHFDQPYRHARHYVGWTDDLLDRLDQHASGHGARLVAVIWHAGIGFTLIRICEGTRRTERAIKNAGGAVRYCPACTPRPLERPLAADARRPHPPHLPQPRRKAVTPMPKTNGSGRNQRNNPYQLDELFVKFHRTPAGIAWRWRTELLTLPSWPSHSGGWTPGPPSSGPASSSAAWPPWSWPCRTPAGSSPGGSGASWPGTGSSGCATKPGCTPAPGGSR